MSSADEEAQCGSSAIETEQPPACDSRSHLQYVSGDGAHLPHGSLRSAGLTLQCTLHVKKKQLASWLWKQDRELPIGKNSVDIVQTVTGGIGFCMYVAGTRELFCSGVAQRVQYEDVRVRNKKRSSAHPSRQQFKPLSPRERELVRQDDDAATGALPYQVPMLASTRLQIRQVSCGISHCIALAGEIGACDSLFAWGIGMYGQLGLGAQQIANTMTPVHTSPELLELLSAAQTSSESASEIGIRCGPFTSYVFVKHTSIVWHWGLLPSNDSTTDRFVLQGVPIEFPMIDEDVEIADVGIGVEHLALLSAPGRVFTWGYGCSGQLGLGHEQAEIIHENAQRVDFFHSGVSITAIACGWNHTIALATDRSVYAWGSNRLGACGATTKFHEYFSPVRISIPQSVSRATHSTGVGGKEEHQCTISCCGGTSILTTRNSSSGTLKTAFVWGVSSDQVAALTPIEVPNVRDHGCFADCKAGFGILRWIYAMEPTDPPQHHHRLLLRIQNESSASDRVSFDLEIDEVVNLKLVALLDDTSITRVKYSGDRLSMRESRLSTPTDSRQIVQLAKQPTAEQLSALDAQLKAVSPGTAQVELFYDGNLVFGCPIEVRVRQKRECGSSAAGSRAASSVTEVCAISVIGRSDRRHHQQQLAMADLRWQAANTRRVRIYGGDTFVLLIQGAQPITGSMLRLEDEFGNELDAEISVHSCFVGSHHEQSALTAAVIRAPGVGVHSIVQVNSSSGLSFSGSKKLAEVVCVMDPAATTKVLTANASFLRKQIAHATTSAGSARARFAAFISTLLGNKQLRGALANTPFVSTADMEVEGIWDFDRELSNREVLCSHRSDPFVLWRSELVSTPIDHDFAFLQRSMASNSDTGERVELMGFWDVLSRWTLEGPEVVELSLMPVQIVLTERGRNNSSAAADKVGQVDVEGEARTQALRIGLSVQQSPLEFLVLGNLVSDSRAVSLPVKHSELEMTEVAAWRDQHGELFYTSHSLSSSQASRASFSIHVYGHESHHFRETATGSLVGQWKTKLHAFLWELLGQSQCSIEDLFQRFLSAAPSDTDHEEQHIRLRDFVSTLEGLGFPTFSCFSGMYLSKQEWLTLFTEIQSLAGMSNSDSPSSFSASPARVTRSVFKTLLIDPFHQSLGGRDAIVQTLLEQLRPSQPSDHGLRSHKGCQHEEDQQQHDERDAQGSSLQVVPWREFMEYLHRFHSALSRIRKRNDQDQQGEKKAVLSVLDCCRILYRFDLRCNGWISVRLFQQSVVASLRDATKKKKTSNGDGLSSSKPVNKGKLCTAVRTAKRPDVDAFSTPNAVQKLFLARAQKQRQPRDDRHPSCSNGSRSALAHTGNTHLARIRSLPVSKLLREGVHFRPQLHASDSNSETAAAEQSY